MRHWEVVAAYDSGDKTVFSDTDRETACTVAREYAIANTNSFFVEGAGVYEVEELRGANGVPRITRYMIRWYDEDGDDVTIAVLEDMASKAFTF